jgi:hypothetical protein
MVWFFQQAAVYKVFRLLREAALRRELRRRLIDNVLQQFQDAHCHPTTLKAHTSTLPPITLPVFTITFLLLFQWDRSCR